MDNTHSFTWTALFESLFSIAGSLLGILLFFFLFSGLSNLLSSKVKRKYIPSILPDNQGKKRPLPKSSPVILQIPIQGVIGKDLLTLEEIETELVESQMGELKEKRVKGILLTIDSPGGSAKDSDGIYRRLKAYKEKYKIPIFAYVDGYCASGAVFIACAADKIFATTSSIVGSVGVRFMLPFLNVHKILEKWDIEVRTFAAGKHKDHLNPFRPWGEDEDSDLLNVLSHAYERFVEVVLRERQQMTREKLVEECGARIYPATEAAKLGFIDEGASDYSLALSALIQAAGIDEKTDYQVIELSKKKSWIKEMAEKSPLLTGRIAHTIDLGPYSFSSLSGNIAYLFLPKGLFP